MSEVKLALLNLINDPGVSSSQKQKFLQITKISTGSVKVEGTMSASSPSAIENTKQDFESSVTAGSTFAGIQVLSSGSTPIKYDASSSSPSSNSSSSSSNTGMIVGIVVSVACAVFIGVGIAVYFLCCKKKESSMDRNLNEKKTTSTVDDIMVVETIQSDHGMNGQYPNLQNGNKNHPPQVML
jgi:hypothetical protein